jgi:hypothetical protein
MRYGDGKAYWNWLRRSPAARLYAPSRWGMRSSGCTTANEVMASSFFTSKGDVAEGFTLDTNIGMAGICGPTPVPKAAGGVGGSKPTCFLDENMRGPEGVRFWTYLGAVAMRWFPCIHAGAESVTLPMRLSVRQ